MAWPPVTLAGDRQALGRAPSAVSPEQIAGWLRASYPDDPSMRISHDTILSPYVRRRRRGCLRTGQAVRRPRGKRLPRVAANSSTPSRSAQRPAEVNGLTVQAIGEGDLVLGKRPSAVLTLVERTSRAVLLVALPAGWRADQVRSTLTAAGSSATRAALAAGQQ